MQIKIRDPVSALTHFSWAILAIPVTILLVVFAANYASVQHVVSFAIFGMSMVLLYTASTVYHLFDVSDRVRLILKKIDHMMIFVLIAGTYTPMCLVILRGAWGVSVLATVWGIALVGILLKAFWHNMPRVFSTIIYIAMGWVVVFAIVPLNRALPVGGMVLLVSGGLVYTLGGVIYAIKWPRLNFKFFNFHDLFHIFVMGGTALHVVLMFVYVLPTQI